MSGILGTNLVTQVAFIVKDIEKTKEKFANFFGVEAPQTVLAGDYEITKTVVEGKPAPDAKCKMAFFDGGPNVRIELIEPNGVKSTWQDFLDEHGEGIHHIAFNIKKMDDKITACEENGMKCTQRGIFGNGGGEYAYIDATSDLKCFIELLENY